MTHRALTLASAATLLAALVVPGVVSPTLAAQPADTSSSAARRAGGFRTYDGAQPLRRVAPGTVLKTRHLSYSLEGVTLPIPVTQLLYRTTDGRGRPTVNVTSVLEPPQGAQPRKVVAYQSFYDSLNPADGPSYAVAGGTSSGGGAVHAESALISPFLLQGYSVVVADTQGATADFASGPEYGRTTLDSLRAVLQAPSTGISAKAKIGMIGYSGGAIATNWAAALAHSYAPDVEKHLVGAAEGGVLVEPAHNLHYVQGSQIWAGVLAMALIGASRAAHIDLHPYLNAYGRSLFKKLDDASISSVLGAYPGLTWQQIAKKRYADPEQIGVYVRTVNKLNLGRQPAPRIPMFIGQGADGELEGTSGSQPGIGKGDGVMIAGDVRTLARRYCARGTVVQYRQYDATSHFTTVPLWMPEAVAWLEQRFGSSKAPSTCGSIAKGNPLTPLPVP